MIDAGLTPGAEYRYQWIGDPNLDKERSNFVEWLEHGTGLVALEGTTLTEYVWRPLSPTTIDGIHAQMVADQLASPSPHQADGRSAAFMGMPALRKAAVAHGVVKVDNGGSVLKLVRGTNGWRLEENELERVDRIPAVWIQEQRVRLVPHLGEIILNASYPTEPEGKV